MLEAFTLLIMTLMAVWMFREGLFRAALTFFNVLGGGFLAFNFWEPIARGMGSLSAGFDRFADVTVLLFLFLAVFGALQLISIQLAVRDLGFPRWVRRSGGVFFGLMAGYFLSGFLICVFQTLPLSQRFLNYDPASRMGAGAPDRIWLAIMHRCSGVVFDRTEGEWFDADGSFIDRYARYRRLGAEGAEPKKNNGEFPTVLDAVKEPESSKPEAK